MAIFFNKGIGFCVIKKLTYEAKLTQLLELEQFDRHENMNVSVVEKIEKKTC